MVLLFGGGSCSIAGTVCIVRTVRMVGIVGTVRIRESLVSYSCASGR